MISLTRSTAIQISKYPILKPFNLTFAPGSWVHKAITRITGPITAGVAPLLNSAVNKKTLEQDSLRENLFSTESHGILFDRTHVQRLSIETPDGAKLDGVIVHGKNIGEATTDYSSRKIVFFVLGASGTYEVLAKPNDASHDFVTYFQHSVSENIDVVAINPRGIGQSTGHPSYEGWALDVYSTLQALKQMGYQSENMAVFGHSMGGWFSAEGLQMFQAESPQGTTPVAYVNYNSFDDIKTLAGASLGIVGSGLARATGWSASAVKAIATFRPERALVAFVNEDTDITSPHRVATTLSTSACSHPRIITVPFDTNPARDGRPGKAHNQTPGSEVAEWIQKALSIAKTDSMPRSALHTLSPKKR